MADGLYMVTTRYFVAGFVMQNGAMVRCAPILKKNLVYWMAQAKYLGK